MNKSAVSLLVSLCSAVASAATLTYTPSGSAPYLWSNAQNWGGSLPGSADSVTIASSLLLANPLILQSGTSASITDGTIGDGILTVESGASLSVSGNLSIVKNSASAGMTGIVTNSGVMSVTQLDVGGYSSKKGTLARFDNFGVLTIGTHFRMGASGTPAIFYNHEGATVNKTSGGGYNFYLGANTVGAVSTLISEGDFTVPSGDQLRAGANTGTTNHIVLAKSGTFTANGHIYMSEAPNTFGTLVMKDNSRLTGTGNIRAPACVNKNSRGPNSLAYIILSNNAAIVKTSGTLYLGANTNSFGCLSLNDNSHVELPTVLYVGAMDKGAGGRVEVHDDARLRVGTYLYVGGSENNTTGELVVTDSAQVTNSVICVGCFQNSKGEAVFSGDSHLENLATAYIAHGNSAKYGSTGNLTFRDSATANFGEYLHVGSGRASKGSLTIKDNASVTLLNRELKLGAGNTSTGLLTVADNAYLGVVGTNALEIGSAANAFAYALVTNGGFVVASNITVATGNNSVGTLEVTEGSVVSNVFHIQIGVSESGTKNNSAQLKMRGGTMLFESGHSKNSTVIWLNPQRDVLAGCVSGWGKLAFRDPRSAVTEKDADTSADFMRPGGITHYGQIVADGEGQMRDLDCGRLGVLPYDSTDPNNNGSTNGWFAVNKGRLKLPRSLPRTSTSHRCVGDYWKVAAGKAKRLMNTFNYELVGAALNNYMFAELYATDRDDIPAGLDAVKPDKTFAVWRIGHFSDGPEVDEPTHPAAFTSATFRFRYCPVGLDSVNYLYVFHHDGTANGRWRSVGHTNSLSADNPIIDCSLDAPSAANWNMGWFAIVGREKPYGAVLTIR